VARAVLAGPRRRRSEVRTEYDDALRNLGLTDAHAEQFVNDATAEDETELWPEHQDAMHLFAALLTQWRVGGLGTPTGLDYAVLPATMRLLGIAREAQRQAFADLCAMEDEALAWFAERARATRPRP
jgi:hypothetical protein